MRTLSNDEIDQVSGGMVWLAALAFVYYNADHIQEFTQGFFDSLSEANF